MIREPRIVCGFTESAYHDKTLADGEQTGHALWFVRNRSDYNKYVANVLHG
jgi:hypothetical protein